MSDSSQSTPTLVSRHNKFVHKTIDRAPIDDQALLLQALDNITFEQFYEFLQVIYVNIMSHSPIPYFV